MDFDELLKGIQGNNPPRQPTRRERYVSAMKEAIEIVEEVMGTVGGDSVVRSMMTLTLMTECLRPEITLPGPSFSALPGLACPYFRSGRKHEDGQFATCEAKDRLCIDIGIGALGMVGPWMTCHTYQEKKALEENSNVSGS